MADPNSSELVNSVCKQQHAAAKLKSEKGKQAVQGMDMFLKLITSIPGIDSHDANTVKETPPEKFLQNILFSCPATINLNQAIGSIEAIAKASKEYILENIDLSAEKAQVIFGFSGIQSSI